MPSAVMGRPSALLLARETLRTEFHLASALGPVVPSAVLSRLVDRFERADAQSEGSGLGLAIVQAMAQRVDSALVLRKLEQLLYGAPRPVALHEPVFAGHEWANVKECLDTGWVSSVGRYVDRFERELGQQVDGYAVAVGNDRQP